MPTLEVLWFGGGFVLLTALAGFSGRWSRRAAARQSASRG